MKLNLINFVWFSCVSNIFDFLLQFSFIFTFHHATTASVNFVDSRASTGGPTYCTWILLGLSTGVYPLLLPPVQKPQKPQQHRQLHTIQEIEPSKIMNPKNINACANGSNSSPTASIASLRSR